MPFMISVLYSCRSSRCFRLFLGVDYRVDNILASLKTFTVYLKVLRTVERGDLPRAPSMMFSGCPS